MQIFTLSTNPHQAAVQLCNKHVVKMILETAQLLSSVWHVQAPEEEAHTAHTQGLLYRRTHVNHPCAKWARKTLGNYRWLCDHGLALSAEYTARYGRTHKTHRILAFAAENPPPALSDDTVTPFARALPETFPSTETAPHVTEAQLDRIVSAGCPKDETHTHASNDWPQDTVAAFRAYYVSKYYVARMSMVWPPGRMPTWFEEAVKNLPPTSAPKRTRPTDTPAADTLARAPKRARHSPIAA